ncbi:MAG: hypothetical protein Hals2KO_09230 [Halioglobus sp.]
MHWLARLLLCASFSLISFVVGLWIASLAGVGEGQGLAAGAIVLFNGLLGAVVGLAVALLLIRTLNARRLRTLLLVVLPIGVLIAVLVLAGILRSRSQMQAHLAEAYTRLPAFRLALAPAPPWRRQSVERFRADWARRTFDISVNGRECSFSLSGAQAVELLTALRNAEGVLYRQPGACDAYPGPGEYHISFTIPEAKPPDSVGDLAPSADCLRAYPALDEPRSAAAALLASVAPNADCRVADQ